MSENVIGACPAPLHGAPRIWWHDGIPSEVRTAAEPHIEAWAHLLPGWCHELGVRFVADEENAASAKGDMPYRRATIYLGPHWLDSNNADREEVIRHEICHVALSPLTDWTKDLIERLAGEDERLAAWLREEWRHRLEGATCDLEDAFRRCSDVSRI